MIGLDFPKTTEENFSGWRWPTLGIAALACLAALMIVDFVVPNSSWRSDTGLQPIPKDAERLTLRWRRREDPRSFTTPAETGLSDETYGLAWISGSSVSIRARAPEHYFKGRAGFELTEVFAAQTEKINGQPAVVHQYLLQGVRTGDMRRAALHAAQDPLVDAIVVSLNPVWLLNGWAIYTESNQRASIVGMKHALLGDWIAAAKYTRPSSIFGSLMAHHFGFVRDRYALSQISPRSKGLSFPLLKKPEGSVVKYVAPERYHPASLSRAPESMKKHAGYRRALMRQTLSTTSESALFLKRMLISLRGSDKPVLLYVAPLPQGINEDPDAKAFMRIWILMAQSLVDEHAGKGVIFHPSSVFGVPGERIHKDIVHLFYGQSVVDEVSRLLEARLGLELDQNDVSHLYGDAE